MKNYSPLRYPGGKTKISPLIKCIIDKINHDLVYIEPFAGGAGAALDLLISGTVQSIVINDYDKSIYAVWKAILYDTNKLIKLIKFTPVDIEQWEIQREIYNNQQNKYSIELAFATLFLNRTNYSGILKAGPIGGVNQTGKYKIGARFSTDELIEKIKIISKYKNKIHVYNKEINSFIRTILPKYKNRFIYFDPPYYKKGKDLYKNFFRDNDHKNLSSKIKNIRQYWLVTYDNEEYIKSLYKEFNIRKYKINHSAANNGKKEEIIFLSDDSLWPNNEELKKLKTSLNFFGDENDKFTK